jgi:ABC-type transport system involved in cytochrome c biogenesis permease subunit
MVWLLLLAVGFVTFFAGFFKYEAQKAAVSYLFSVVFFFLCGVTSVRLTYITDSGAEVYTGNAIVGLVLIPLALVAAGFAVDALTEQSIREAGV